MKSASLLITLAWAGICAAQSTYPDQHAGALSSAQHGHPRKTIAFGPQGHARQSFKTNEFSADAFAASAKTFSSIKDYHEVALQLAAKIVGQRQAKFYVRSDSYIDAKSGLAHVYVKQTINGLEVEDGNLNVVLSQDGQVLSYGSSLYTGAVPDAFTNPAQAQDTYDSDMCKTIQSTISTLLDRLPAHDRLAKRDQLGLESPFYVEEEPASASLAQLDDLQKELFIFCEDPSDSPFLRGRDFGSRLSGAIKQSLGSKWSGSVNDAVMDARLAVLEFIKLATADEELAQMLSSPDASPEHIASSIVSTFEQSVRPDGMPDQVEMLHAVPGTTDAVSARLGYIQTADGDLNLVWRFNVPMDHATNSNFYQVTVDATTGEVRSSADWVASAPVHAHSTTLATEEAEHEAFYKVLHWGLNDPSEGNRTLEAGVIDRSASPYGWHSVGDKKHYNDTRGNNVIASAFGAGMDDWLEPDRPRPQGKRQDDGSLVFDNPFPWRNADKRHEELSPDTYADASVVNLFYTLNKYHDLLHLYGFDAPSGNFEEAESSEGGRGGDAIVAFAISSAGINNADFSTPPDGTKPRVRMYKWHTKENATERDGDFEEGIIVHEMTHGVSTRLTGGPADSSCLGWGEAGGMGEGWGDFFATIIRRKSPTRDIYTMGSWASHQKAGIRRYPYSTNLTLNPETYKTLDSPGYWGVHAIGEVWAGMLYQVEEGLRAKLGWAPDLFPPLDSASQEEKDKFWLTPAEVDSLTGGKPRASKRRVPRQGNTLAIQLILDGMKLQPCRPSFFDARDAIIQADKHLTGGANECLLWTRFAQRGLGINAKVVGRTPWGGGVRTDGHQVPLRCKNADE